MEYSGISARIFIELDVGWNHDKLPTGRLSMKALNILMVDCNYVTGFSYSNNELIHKAAYSYKICINVVGMSINIVNKSLQLQDFQ